MRPRAIVCRRRSRQGYYGSAQTRSLKKTTDLPELFFTETPDTEIESKELNAVFHGLLHSLPEPYKNVLLLTEFEGLSQEQLAKRLGISLSGAKSRVQRAREQLKQLLLDYCHDEFFHAAGSQPCPKGLLPTVQETKRRSPSKSGIQKNLRK